MPLFFRFAAWVERTTPYVDSDEEAAAADDEDDDASAADPETPAGAPCAEHAWMTTC